MIKVLIVCSGNAVNFSLEKNQAFIYDQIKAVEDLQLKVQFKVFALMGKGVKGYLSQLKHLKNEIRNFKPNMIHAHGGHVGMLCVIQRKIPVIVTFHGSDINKPANKLISTLVSLISTHSIFVSQQLRTKMLFSGKKFTILPCGVDRSIFFPIDKNKAIKQLKLDKLAPGNYILFSSAFDNSVKNYPLAQRVVNHFPTYRLQEIKNRTRAEVNLLINGAELLLMTSYSEGSPQVIKEALACNQRIVTVAVGDVVDQLRGVSTCRVCAADEEQLITAINEVLAINSRNEGRIASERFDSVKIAKQLVQIYESVIRNKSLQK